MLNTLMARDKNTVFLIDQHAFLKDNFMKSDTGSLSENRSDVKIEKKLS
jgi:hypothetical protein